ncbi:hypothetical protein [Litoribrevibacter albus]|uniref:DUF1573 domain-containing protein n=1 Tax=Litoribrevibacter albus TaxID=1473156 RepID=A0AA37WA76_9GAMM|nr:hypothetical protein [Litoribrevibacter albus]GLQ33326.1 hypothetical protein GCM10007876_38060 [Litoribrevibacter albus]
MYKIKQHPIALMSALLLTSILGCAQAQSSSTLEPIHAIFLEQSEQHLLIHFKAISRGCTSPQDFDVEFNEADNMTVLAIHRITPDRCRKMPKPIYLTKRIWLKDINTERPITLKNQLLIK